MLNSKPPDVKDLTADSSEEEEEDSPHSKNHSKQLNSAHLEAQAAIRVISGLGLGI